MAAIRLEQCGVERFAIPLLSLVVLGNGEMQNDGIRALESESDNEGLTRTRVPIIPVPKKRPRYASQLLQDVARQHTAPAIASDSPLRASLPIRRRFVPTPFNADTPPTRMGNSACNSVQQTAVQQLHPGPNT